MINITELKPSTIDALQKIYTEHTDTVEYMQKFGTAFEKAIAIMILAASGGDKNE